jgi:hypothetical protein
MLALEALDLPKAHDTQCSTNGPLAWGCGKAPAKGTSTYGHTRLENRGMNGFSRCSIMAGRVRSSPLCGGLAMIVPYPFSRTNG